MVEIIQSCSASLVNASALNAIDKQEAKGESHEISKSNDRVIAEISAELQRERQKNAELLEKISFLESQIIHNKAYHEQGQVETGIRKFKRQKTEVPTSDVIRTESETDSEKKSETRRLVLPQKDQQQLLVEDRLVNWMSTDDEARLSRCCAKSKDIDYCEDSEDSDELEDGDCREEQVCRAVEDCTEDDKAAITSGKRPGNVSHGNKKPPKVAFCPREVKRLIESEALQQANAQSHTMRKIIVFASLGMRHGCEDMYELDFNHFSIVRKGEPYESPGNPGEHVVYENPRLRRKVFYPNRQNPTLCPVRILEEEKTMRPSDSSCPSCLFLCIKYGGRTRNLPQNEYVRQRMGRNKLKSFGPLFCRKASLANIRRGSFFFKALGITLLVMSGFPDDLVQRETKYRNLDLLQKYYRTDQEAEGEELFTQHPVISDTASPSHFTGKACPTKPKGKKHTNNNNTTTPTKPDHSNTQTASSSARFGPMGFAGGFDFDHTTPKPMNSLVSNASSYHNQIMMVPQNLHHHRHHHQALMYWPQPQYYGYASPYHGYRPFPIPSSGSYVSIRPHPYSFHVSGGPLTSPGASEGHRKDDVAPKEDESDSDCTTSSTETKD